MGPDGIFACLNFLAFSGFGTKKTNDLQPPTAYCLLQITAYRLLPHCLPLFKFLKLMFDPAGRLFGVGRADNHVAAEILGFLNDFEKRLAVVVPLNLQ